MARSRSAAKKQSKGRERQMQNTKKTESGAVRTKRAGRRHGGNRNDISLTGDDSPKDVGMGGNGKDIFGDGDGDGGGSCEDISLMGDDLARCGRKRARSPPCFGDDNLPRLGTRSIGGNCKDGYIHGGGDCKGMVDRKGKNIESPKIKIRLCDDLLANLFNRLPLKSLCRFKSASKSTCSLILDNFHRSQRRTLVCRTIPNRYDFTEFNPISFYSIDGHGIATHKYTTIPLSDNDTTISHPKFCNGLICFFEKASLSFFVFNPTTQQKITLPKFSVFENVSHDDDDIPYRSHFGYDPIFQKFKILCWTNFPHCHIYTLGTQSWRPLTYSNKYNCILYPTMDTFIDQMLYHGCNNNKILSFNFTDESFTLFDGPPKLVHNLKETKSFSMQLFELEGCLCAAHYHFETRFIDFWMLKDSFMSNDCDKGWIKVASVVWPRFSNFNRTDLYSTRTGEIVLANSCPGPHCLYSYNFLTGDFHTMNINGLPAGSSFWVDDFVENSVNLVEL